MASSTRPESRQPWLERAAPLAILLIAFGLRLERLGGANLWWDEALAAWAVRKGFVGVTLWTASDVHPPLYFWTLWAWVQVAGESEFALRALSVVAGALTVVAALALGRLVAGRAAGNAAALLTALARFQVWWSQETRMYVLAGFLGLLSTFYFLRWLRAEGVYAVGDDGSEPPRSKGLLALYVFTAAASLYTIFLMAAVVLAQNLLVLLLLIGGSGALRKRLFMRWAVAQVTILALLAIWLAFSWGRMQSWSVTEPFGVRLFAQLWLTLLTSGASTGVGRYMWAWIVPLTTLALGALAALLAWKRSRRIPRRPLFEALALALCAVVPGVLIYLSSMPRALFYTPRIEARYFVPFAPYFWVLLGCALALVVRRWRVAGWLCGLLLLAQWLYVLPEHYAGRYLRDELQTMVRAIVSQAQPGDAVLLDAGNRYPIFLYYYDGLPVDARPPVFLIDPRQAPLTREEATEILKPLAQTHARLWLAEVDAHLTDPDYVARQWLREALPEALAWRYGHNRLTLFARDQHPPGLTSDYAPQYPLSIRVGADGSLRGWELPVNEYAPESIAHVSLLWEQVPGEPVALALVNPQGLLVWREAREPGTRRESLRMQFDIPINASISPGDYGILLTSAPDGDIRLGALRVVENGPSARQLEAFNNADARLGEEFVLRGYALLNDAGQTPRTIAGERLILDLAWLAEGQPQEDYSVFAHLIGQAYNPKTNGPLWGQHDSPPVGEAYPTSRWRAGDIILDRHIIPLEPDLPAGEYRIAVGMYDASGKRLTFKGADGQPVGDHLMLPLTLVKRG